MSVSPWKHISSVLDLQTPAKGQKVFEIDLVG